MRRLATIVTIKNIEAVPNRDFIGLASMNENFWKVIVRKSDFNSGDKAVYFEIDSWLPDRPVFEFLRAQSLKVFRDRLGYRIRSMKMTVVSQGLLMPLKSFPELIPAENSAVKFQPGDDVTELLGVELYEMPEPAEEASMPKTKRRRKYPHFVRRTDENRIQSFKPEQLKQLDGKNYVVTEKLDGTSSTYYYNQGKFGLCSRNLELTTLFDKGLLGKIFEWLKRKIFWSQFHYKFGFSKGIYEDIALKYKLHKKLPAWCREHKRNIAVQGEILGPGISNNRLKQNDFGFYVFNIFDIDKQGYLDWDEVCEIARTLGLQTVPVIEKSRRLNFSVTAIDELIESADGITLLYSPSETDSARKNTKNQIPLTEIEPQHPIREGVVWRERSERGKISRFSFKIISNEYLLEHGL
ncbi:hypothetical protein FACS189419_01460 [Planctomycetales bacterium]|nr:hypothetical protein FACS189419_01460 [Planctomycetales bacterium]